MAWMCRRGVLSDAARAGIARSWQGVELFEELTVRDNLLVADDNPVAAAIRA